jgi:hypothetical protein
MSLPGERSTFDVQYITRSGFGYLVCVSERRKTSFLPIGIMRAMERHRARRHAGLHCFGLAFATRDSSVFGASCGVDQLIRSGPQPSTSSTFERARFPPGCGSSNMMVRDYREANGVAILSDSSGGDIRAAEALVTWNGVVSLPRK